MVQVNKVSVEKDTKPEPHILKDPPTVTQAHKGNMQRGPTKQNHSVNYNQTEEQGQAHKRQVGKKEGMCIECREKHNCRCIWNVFWQHPESTLSVWRGSSYSTAAYRGQARLQAPQLPAFLTLPEQLGIWIFM